MPFFVPASGFSQQVEEFAKQLSWLSDRDIEVHDDDASPIRSTSYYLELEDGVRGALATFDYREEFQKVSGGWLRSRYVYELRFAARHRPPRGSRRAHHAHGRWGFHQHCETPTSPKAVHYADVERLLQATHELFVRQLLSSSPVDCSGLRRL